MSLLSVRTAVDGSVKDTIAFRIVRQILDHVYGNDQKMDDEEFVHLYRTFVRLGGSWEAVVRGDINGFDLLESLVAAFVKVKKTLDE